MRTFELPFERVELVPLGVTVPAAGGDISKYELAKPYFLVLGSDYPHKNLQFALESWQLLKQRLGDRAPELVFAGPRSRVAHSFYERGQLGSARYLGELAPHEVGAVLRGATALVSPSTYEGFGLPMLEAMALGKNVAVLPLETELSSFELADLLNVSRPYAIGLLEKGVIPFRSVGVHRRIRLDDALQYKAKQRQCSLEAMAALQAENEALGLQ